MAKLWRQLFSWLERSFATVVVLCAAGTPSSALDPARSLAQLHHTSWSQRDGVPTDVEAIAQTPDGFLWLGTGSGLYRFDGVRAEPFAIGQLPTANVFSLATSTNGDLWAGLDLALVARVSRGKVTIFSVPTPGQKTPVLFLAPDQDGTIWVATRDRVLNFDGAHWRLVDSPWPSASSWSEPGGIWGLRSARDGTLWAKNLIATYYLRRGARRFVQAPGYAGGGVDFARDHDGRLWTGELLKRGLYVLPDLKPDHAVPPPDFGSAVPPYVLGTVMLDRDGTMWNANRVTGGLRRVVAPLGSAVAERFTVPQGLTSDLVFTVFEDHEGDVWAATERGIDRFRAVNVVAEPEIPVRLQAAQLAATKDAVWLYSGMDAQVHDPLDVGQRLYRLRPGQAPDLVASHAGQLQAMAAIGNDDIVIAPGDGLARWHDRTRTPIAIPPDLKGSLIEDFVAKDPTSLLVSFVGKGAWRLSSGRWAQVTTSASLAESPQVALDAHGTAWLFYRSGLVVRVTDTQTTEFRSPQSEIGQIQATLLDRDGGFNFVGTAGIARFDGHSFRFLPASRIPQFRSGWGMVETPDGNFWIGTQAGILRISREALLRGLNDPDAPLPFQLFDTSDGFTGQPPADVFNSSMVVGPDGRVWFLTNNGVAWIDPNHLYRNNRSPPVVITSLSAGRHRFDMPQNVSLPAGTSQLQMDYTALSLAAPERVRFRYRLTGVETEWTDAGDRRQAFYTNVPPGEHTFQVIAMNNDGVWNTTGDSITFNIAPTFYQTIWFELLIALVLSAIVWLAYSIRLRQEQARLQTRFDIRIAERERIARELHDTLLQGFQGLVLRFQAVANRVQDGGEVRTLLDDALDRADATLIEGRARVRDLRATAVEGDLAKTIMTNAHHVIDGDTPHLLITVEGSPRRLHPLVGEEVTRIAEEAIRNAAQHARANSIEVILSYGIELRLIVRDDGIGMPRPILSGGEKTGHYGLVGMRERAQRVGGRFEISSRERAGTEIALSIPGRVAYNDRPMRFLGWLWPSRSEGSA